MLYAADPKSNRGWLSEWALGPESFLQKKKKRERPNAKWLWGTDLNRGCEQIVVRRRGADGRIPDHTLGRGASSSAAESAGYPRGSYDTCLLVKYEHHVARHLWFGEERGPKKELKVARHGLKLTSRVPLALP
ncbi:hypothetical protein KIW84_041044 [Lathyrus oleraceus]|uniref:Uncharacterized protein n=1 Tax=Pisum sativum TaxID=3888 RepID=A0A9D4X8Y6_PEA|nr:hypothetical protein KIW84_041044 [Pisum sativum]